MPDSATDGCPIVILEVGEKERTTPVVCLHQENLQVLDSTVNLRTSRVRRLSEPELRL